MPNKLKKFCKLSKFLEQEDAVLYEVFDNLCMTGLLFPRKGSSLTFLYPSDKAVRDNIIKLSYSDEPQDAISILKKLLIHNIMSSASEFKSASIVNYNKEQLEVESVDGDTVKFKGGPSAKLSKSFKYFSPSGHSANVVVYDLKGDPAKISTKAFVGQVVQVEKSGGSGITKYRKLLTELLTAKFIENPDLSNNVFIKKVYLQMGCLLKSGGVLSNELEYHLGNDEFTDSLLLDQYCARMHPQHFEDLYICLSADNDPRCIEKLNTITVEMYLSRKEQICKTLCGSDKANELVQRPQNLFTGLSTPYDIPAKVKDIYKANNCSMKALARDLFVIRANVEKSEWVFDITLFREFINCMSLMHNDNMMGFLDNKINSRAYIATIWHTLLKSDMLMYKPQARFDVAPAGYSEVEPNPIETVKYSINRKQALYRVRVGGNGGAMAALSHIENLM